MEKKLLTRAAVFACVFALYICNGGTISVAQSKPKAELSERKWLAGDHHIHSHFSANYDTSTDPPTPSFE